MKIPFIGMEGPGKAKLFGDKKYLYKKAKEDEKCGP
tara:strand:+ start:1921 stop:2028 length:108 start_codon:yes stop_codon:yes gene_type:complete